MDVDVGLENVPSQTGTAILDYADGKIVKVRIFLITPEKNH